MSTNPICRLVLSTFLASAVLAGTPACSDEHASVARDEFTAEETKLMADAASQFPFDESAGEWEEAPGAVEDDATAMLQELIDAANAEQALIEDQYAVAWEGAESAGYADPAYDGGAYEYATGWGSGERNDAGDWSHSSDAAGLAVGGTANGCIYAGDWSNC